MTSPDLKERCLQLFGKKEGRLVYQLMKRLANLDFCVATAMDAAHVSIARNCRCVGEMFKIYSSAYKEIIGRDNRIISIYEASYEEIASYLPFAKFSEAGEQMFHCDVDRHDKRSEAEIPEIGADGILRI